MKTQNFRETVELSDYPDLVVIYLGMRVRALAGLKTLAGLGPQIMRAGDERPDGLLHCENNFLYRLFPPRVGMRCYWRDFWGDSTSERSPQSGQRFALASKSSRCGRTTQKR